MTDCRDPRTDTVLEFRAVRHRFDSATSSFLAVREIDLSVERGQVICIVGPSGCGKSTLLNMAAGLLRPTSGTVLFEGSPVTQINHRVGYVTQKDSLLPWRTVDGNVALPLELISCPRADRRRRVHDVLETVGLAHCSKMYPSQLSGGMRKRVGLAQTLVYNPSTILMDEPFGALDAQLRLDLQQELLRVVAARNLTVLFITHDLEEAILLGDRVVLFSASPGTIVSDTSVPFDRPRDLATLRGDPLVGSLWADLWRLLEHSPAKRGSEDSSQVSDHSQAFSVQ